jgi:signal transduction histidine kinase
MKQKTVLSQITWRIGIILVIITVFSSSLLYYFGQREFQSFVNSQVNYMIKDMINLVQLYDQTNKSIDDAVNDRFYEIGRSVESDLQGKPLHSITQEDLKKLKDKYKLAVVAILVQDPDKEFTFIQSSDQQDIGGTSRGCKSCGEWTKAEQQLLTEGRVDGFGVMNYPKFWIGPVSGMFWDPQGTYKHGRYVTTDGNTPYIVAISLSYKQLQTAFFNQIDSQKLLKENNVGFQSIEVINVLPVLEEAPRRISDFSRDTKVLLGTDAYPQKEDKNYINQGYKTKKEVTISFPTVGQDGIAKSYIPLPNDRMMILTRDLSLEKGTYRKLFIVVLLLFVTAIFIIHLMMHRLTKRRLAPLTAIEAHLDQVASGDLSGRLKIEEDNELGWLGGKINDMTLRMQSLIDHINQKAKEDLDTTEKTYQVELKSVLTSVRSQRHDMKNHLTVIWGLVKTQSYDKLSAYILSLVNEVKEVDEFYRLGSPALAVLMNTKSSISAERKIAFRTDVDTDSFEQMKTTDLIRLLSNLIDNAIEATETLPVENRFVQVGLKRVSNHYVFEIHNSGPTIPPEVRERMFEMGFSTKITDGSQERGYGMAIVKEVLRKYNGEISIHSENNQTRVCIRIPIPETQLSNQVS